MIFQVREYSGISVEESKAKSEKLPLCDLRNTIKILGFCAGLGMRLIRSMPLSILVEHFLTSSTETRYLSAKPNKWDEILYN